MILARPLKTLQFWAAGIRLYIALGSLILAGQVWWWASVAYAGDPDLMASRLHETYGWISLGMLAVALSIGPAYKLIPNLGGARLMRDARRLVGVGAFGFASLHAAVAYIVSFQAANPSTIADEYARAFVVGSLALLLLSLLAFTSFNAAMRRLGPWWFRLHRLVYAAVVLAVWHALSIGVHAASVSTLAILIGSALTLLVSHLAIAWQQDKSPTIWQALTLGGLFIVTVILSNYGIQNYIDQNNLQGHGHQ